MLGGLARATARDQPLTATSRCQGGTQKSAPKQAGGTPAPQGTRPPAKRIPGTGVVSVYFTTRYSAGHPRQPALIHWAGVHIISPPEIVHFSRKDFCLFVLRFVPGRPHARRPGGARMLFC